MNTSRQTSNGDITVLSVQEDQPPDLVRHAFVDPRDGTSAKAVSGQHKAGGLVVVDVAGHGCHAVIVTYCS
jgi:hypothetical protein